MERYSIPSPYLERIRALESSEEMELIINEKKGIIALPVAIAASKLLFSMYAMDKSVRSANLHVVLNKDENVLKLFDVLNGVLVDLDEMDAEDFFRLGEYLGNSDLIVPYYEKLSSSLSMKTIIKCLSVKSKWMKRDKEIDFAAENFVELAKGPLLEWAENADLFMIEKILYSPNLVLNHEDELLNFVINVCAIRKDAYPLIESIHLEYCSVEACIKFCDFTSTLSYNENSFPHFWKCAMRRLKADFKPLTTFIPKRHIQKVIITAQNPLNGIFAEEHKENGVEFSASGVKNGSIEDLVSGLDNHNFVSNDQENPWISFEMTKKAVKPTGYMLRGRFDEYHQMQSWIVEGKTSDGKWILLDQHQNDPLRAKEIRTYDINANNCQMVAFKLTQTSKNISHSNNLCLLGFDVFGEIQNVE